MRSRNSSFFSMIGSSLLKSCSFRMWSRMRLLCFSIDSSSSLRRSEFYRRVLATLLNMSANLLMPLMPPYSSLFLTFGLITPSAIAFLISTRI